MLFLFLSFLKINFFLYDFELLNNISFMSGFLSLLVSNLVLFNFIFSHLFDFFFMGNYLSFLSLLLCFYLSFLLFFLNFSLTISLFSFLLNLYFFFFSGFLLNLFLHSSNLRGILNSLIALFILNWLLVVMLSSGFCVGIRAITRIIFLLQFIMFLFMMLVVVMLLQLNHSLNSGGVNNFSFREAAEKGGDDQYLWDLHCV